MTLSWLPNFISITRIALVGPILIYIQTEQYGLALALFLVAGVSDGIDGYLAKTFDWQTRLGVILDPFADKVLVGVTFFAIVINGLAPLWFAVLVILRDIVIMTSAITYNFCVSKLQGEPTRISKLNTALQIIFIICILSEAGIGWPGQFFITLIGAGMTVTLIVSSVDYLTSWMRGAREKRLRLRTVEAK